MILRGPFDHLGFRLEALGPEKGDDETNFVMLPQQLIHQFVIGQGGGRTDGKRQGSEIKFEQPIAARRLGVIVLLRCRPRDDLDLPGIETEALVNLP